MDFKRHSDLVGQHAFLSGSKYHWIHYSEEKLAESYKKFLAVQKGTQLHDFAKRCIELGIKLPKVKKSLNQYVNDAIDYKMIPEQVLFYTNNAFGTADSINFYNNFLRIHDLKTGISQVYMHQLEVYTSLFCLEYDFSPNKIDIELRIYQFNDIVFHHPEPKIIEEIMEKIISFDRMIDKIKTKEELWLR